MSFSIIITAGGIGKRMQSSIPKQFLPLHGEPILMHTIRRFYDFDKSCQIILTLPEDWHSYWKQLMSNHRFEVPHIMVSGGIERYNSIENALSSCKHSTIGIHDGVRPLVSKETISRCLSQLVFTPSAIPVMPLKESLRKEEKEHTIAVDRSQFYSVQTPQFFHRNILLEAYKQKDKKGITDDASLVERSGISIDLVEGNEENLKITTPTDLKIAHLLFFS